MAKEADLTVIIVIALIGGILTTVGVFLPWSTTDTSTQSGWDIYSTETLAGGIIVLLGALAVLLGSKVLGVMIPVGSLLVLVAAIQVFRSISDTPGSDVGYGILLCIIGGVLALIGTLGIPKAK